MGIFSFFSESYTEVVMDWAIKHDWRVFFVTMVHLGLFIWLAVWIWGTESNLWIFASATASKVLAVLVGFWGFLMSVNVFGALGSQASWERHVIGPPDRPEDRCVQVLGPGRSVAPDTTSQHTVQYLAQNEAGK